MKLYSKTTVQIRVEDHKKILVVNKQENSMSKAMSDVGQFHSKEQIQEQACLWISRMDRGLSQTEHIIPGHGNPTTLENANKDSYEYLKFLRKSVSEFIDDDGDISEISKVDQSPYKYLSNFDSLSGRNAQQVYTEMEFE